jgi:hypothetical protein
MRSYVYCVDARKKEQNEKKTGNTTIRFCFAQPDFFKYLDFRLK